VVSCIRCGCAEGWHSGYDGPCLNAGCRCRAYEPDWAALDALAVEDVLDGFPAPGVTLRHLRPVSRAVTAHLVELTEPPFYWPLDHLPQHAAEVQLDERPLAEREEAGSRPADRTSHAPLAQWIVRQPSELVDGSSSLSGGAAKPSKAALIISRPHVSVAQSERAPGSGPGGRRFKSCRGHHGNVPPLSYRAVQEGCDAGETDPEVDRGEQRGSGPRPVSSSRWTSVGIVRCTYGSSRPRTGKPPGFVGQLPTSTRERSSAGQSIRLMSGRSVVQGHPFPPDCSMVAVAQLAERRVVVPEVGSSRLLGHPNPRSRRYALA